MGHARRLCVAAETRLGTKGRDDFKKYGKELKRKTIAPKDLQGKGKRKGDYKNEAS